MGLYLLLLTAGALVIRGAAGTSADCSYNIHLEHGRTYRVYSPNYYNVYRGVVDCRWEVVAASNSKIDANCTIDIRDSNNCADARFSVYPSGDASRSDAQVYCGYGTFSVQSTNNRMVITLTGRYDRRGGRFLCSLTATVPTTPTPPTCECGWKNEAKIVNGQETGVNEYPMMAGLVDIENRIIYCGATVISNHYLMTAAHCVDNRQIQYTAVVVGELDVTTGAETNSTKSLRIDNFVVHPQYNSLQNDIAVIRVAEDIVFSREVGPACLPFRFPTTSVGTAVNVLGWGKLEYGGEKSAKLMGTQQEVVNISRCQQDYPNAVSTTNQLCTYKPRTGYCQFDSGVPMLWMGPENRLYLVGVISYGTGCASDVLEVNTRVYPYIDWILNVTLDAEYCVK